MKQMESKMRIELGGVYKDGHGDKIGPMTRSETGGDTPWYCPNNGLYRDDGSFIHNDPHGNDIVSEWVDEEVGTLAELGVKAGDVVECVYSYSSEGFKKLWTVGRHYTSPNDGSLECDDKVPQRSSYSKFRIISRADNADTAPKTWGEMTDAEKGALLLAHHDGKVIEYFSGLRGCWATVTLPPVWPDGAAYRIKPEPKRETVTMRYIAGKNSMSTHTHSDATHRITFNTIDGEPDCGSVKMEAL